MSEDETVTNLGDEPGDDLIAWIIADSQEAEEASREEWSVSHREAVTALRDAAIAEGFVSRESVLDGIFTRAELASDPLWDRNPLADCWHRRSPEFYVARADGEFRVHEIRGTAEITLNLAMLELERELPAQIDGPPYDRVAEHGTYKVVASRDCGTVSGHRTPGEAIREWRSRLLAYAAECPNGTVIWRTRPEIDGSVPFGQTEPEWVVWSRLVIVPAP